MAPVARFFTPYRPRQDLPCTSAGDPAPYGWRAISVPLALVMSGLSRSVAEPFQCRPGLARSSHRSASQADSASSILVTRPRFVNGIRHLPGYSVVAAAGLATIAPLR
jgi:hypothetical protein